MGLFKSPEEWERQRKAVERGEDPYAAEKQAELEAERNLQRVVITDIKMPFHSMVIFMVKWALASIPAAILLALIMFAVTSALGGAIFGVSR